MKDLRETYRMPDTDTPLVFLAPMAGYTDAAMRQISHEFGRIPLAYTEMVNAYACVRGDPKTWCLLETLPGECPVVAHIFGSDPSIMAEAARKIAATGRFAGIDVNAGCPAPRVMHDGAGATLIKDPQRLHDILSAIVHAVRLPVSVKTRIGPAPGMVLVFENLAAAEEAGVSSFAVHGRFTSQGHSGPVHYDILAEVKAKARIPVLGNGNVVSPATGRLMFTETGVDAVLVARGAIGNPWMLCDLRDALKKPLTSPTQEELIPTGKRPQRELREFRKVIQRHGELQTELVHRRFQSTPDVTQKEHDEAVAAAFRPHLFCYLRGIYGSHPAKRKLMTCTNIREMYEAVDECLRREAAFRETETKGV